ncbi:hypothetical protein CYMTET_55332 [Cymbomonas tetramitiformis]|uniref:Uncharacterized protein n=1 Tax=Cymbomonas tetramitiformis TaxID=36881 RepID=A0AAE0BE87_9CHLO|nr:hypothetical protein CYMTET_55332 [Cymbomonas tetramitiformis]
MPDKNAEGPMFLSKLLRHMADCHLLYTDATYLESKIRDLRKGNKGREPAVKQVYDMLHDMANRFPKFVDESLTAPPEGSAANADSAAASAKGKGKCTGTKRKR